MSHSHSKLHELETDLTDLSMRVTSMREKIESIEAKLLRLNAQLADLEENQGRFRDELRDLSDAVDLLENA